MMRKLADMGAAMRSKAEVIASMIGFQQPKDNKEDLIRDVREAGELSALVRGPGWEIVDKQFIKHRSELWVRKWMGNGDVDAAGSASDQECKFRAAELAELSKWVESKISAGADAERRLLEIDQRASQ